MPDKSAYVFGNIFFFNIDPSDEEDIEINLLDTDGSAYSDLDGDFGTLTVYSGSTSLKTYDATVSGSVLTVATSGDLPDTSGIFTAELSLSQCFSGGWVEIIKSVSEDSTSRISISYISRNLGRYVTGSFVLSSDDFEDWMLAQACYMAVQEWNETEGTQEYTPDSFPDISKLRDGSVGFAMITAGSALQRERMPNDTGDISVDDKQRAGFYIEQGNMLVTRFRDWASYKGEQELIKRGFGLA